MPDILVENVGKLYGNRTVLENISFRITQPGIYLVAGPNGSGKTTLIELIAGLRKATSGKIELNGFQAGSIEAKRQVHWLSQHNNLRKNCTVIEELTLIKTLFNKKVEDIAYLKQFELDRYYKHQTRKLSGGLRRRLLIAMTLLANQDIMVLDEPASGLDTDNRDEIWNAIKEYSHEKIVLVSDHYLNQAALYSDYVFMLGGGKIMLNDKKEKILNHIDYSEVIRVKKGGLQEVKKTIESLCNQYVVKSSGSVHHIFIRKAQPELKALLKRRNIDIHPIDFEDIYFYYTGTTLDDKGGSYACI